MKQKQENIEEKLQDLLDERTDEKSVDDLIASERELHVIAEADRLMKRMDLEEPSPGFVARVMGQLDEVIIPNAIRNQGILIFLGVLLVLTVSVLFLGNANAEAITIPENVDVVGKTVSLNGLSNLFDASVVIKVLMFLTFLLSLLVLDIAVLRPIFRKKKHISY